MPLDEFAFAAAKPDERPFGAPVSARPVPERFESAPCSLPGATGASANLAVDGFELRAKGIGTIPSGGFAEAVAEAASESGSEPFASGKARATASFRREARFA